MIELAVICALLVALCAWQQWDRRVERQEVALERAGLLAAAHSREQDLIQWAKEPQTASIQHYNREVEVEAPPAVNEFDDDDYWQKINGLSRDELAELEAEREVTGG